ncbi:hypothetical protein [Halobacillus salinus]|uniref:Uncharacterized protein n=1 Tax=Halobacillus salinus TaxID=192814 RepID=A0A4Z0H473_9BACI|nr:hypothetical protein [Halobacillus salinus]TGB04677.1 hypothetical protein E4663_06710 [Halobacillus salinus]
MKELKKQIALWEAQLDKKELDPEVRRVFDNMSSYLINQKEYIIELGDMVENAQEAYAEQRKEYLMEGINLKH